MPLLHATLLDDGCLLLWNEESADPARPRRVLQRGGPHPLAADEARVQAVVRSVLELPHDLPVARALLHLPSSGGAPLASTDRSATECEIAPWNVTGCPLRASEAVVLLANLQPGSATAGDLETWSAAARWTLSLLRRQRLIPDLDADERRGADVGWLPAVDAARDSDCLAHLAAALPPSGYCHAPETAPPRTLLMQFVGRAVDELARYWIGREGVAAPRMPATWPLAAREWGRALCEGSARLDGIDASALGAEVRRWQRAWLPAEQRLDFRSGFQLTEADDWTISVYLETVEPPVTRVEAATIWDGDGGPLVVDERRLERPQEKLLADLGRALRVFPALERMLGTSRPTSCHIGLPAASQFIRSTAWLLQENGFAVDLPRWATDPAQAPQLELTVRDGGEAGFGLDALLDYSWQVALGGDRLDPREFKRLAEEKIPLVRWRDQWSLIEPARAEAMLALWEQRAAGPLTLRDALQLAAGCDAMAVDLCCDGELAALEDARKVAPIEPPAALQASLRNYQQHGFSWLVDRVRRGLGACLADDMGLGKTIQMISLMLWDRGRGPWLLVCPTSLVGNWLREMERFAPSLRVSIFHGRRREVEDCDVVLTTYGLAGRDATLRATRWRGIALDEAQNVKNHDSRQARGVRALQAEVRIAMTGTPVENRLADLWSIMEFINPGLLGSAEAFRRRFAIPIERYADEGRRAHLRKAVSPFLLRRVKTDPTIVPDLPEKLERRVYCPLTREQAALYEATVRERLERIEQSEGIARRGVVLSTMLRLKQICNHPVHFLDDGSPLLGRSGKLDRLEAMLDEVLAGGERALVFTQFREWGVALTEHLRQRLGVDVQCLHGETPRDERDRLVARFQSDDGFPVFVLSLKAGGVGLNLTRASHIFHFDRWWNPAVENQATDRAFRIGQRRDVQVHKFLCLGTLEESIDRLLASKVGLAESVVGGGEAWLTELTTGELRDMFTLREGAVEEDI